jgi:transposase
MRGKHAGHEADIRNLLARHFGEDGELGALLRKEGLYSSHLVTWRRQRAHGLTPKTRGRKKTAADPRVKKLAQENRRLTSRLQQAEAIIAFQKKVSELLRLPLKPFVSDEDD